MNIKSLYLYLKLDKLIIEFGDTEIEKQISLSQKPNFER